MTVVAVIFCFHNRFRDAAIDALRFLLRRLARPADGKGVTLTFLSLTLLVGMAPSSVFSFVVIVMMLMLMVVVLTFRCMMLLVVLFLVFTSHDVMQVSIVDGLSGLPRLLWSFYEFKKLGTIVFAVSILTYDFPSVNLYKVFIINIIL